MTKYFLVPVNVRYREYFVVKVEDPDGDGTCDAQGAVGDGGGTQVESMQEYVETMDSEHWDDPEEIAEERYKELTVVRCEVCEHDEDTVGAMSSSEKHSTICAECC